MQPLNVVLLQGDPGMVESLLASLHQSFRTVRQAPCLSELRSYLAEHPGGIAIMDMEIVTTFDVAHLSHDFPEARIVCNHERRSRRLLHFAGHSGDSPSRIAGPGSRTNGCLIPWQRSGRPPGRPFSCVASTRV